MKNNSEKAYSWRSEEYAYDPTIHETKRDALKDCTESLGKVPDGTPVTLDTCKKVPLPDTLDTDWILEQLDEDYSDRSGCDTYLYEHVSDDDKAWLEAEFRNVIKRFHERTGTTSNWWEPVRSGRTCLGDVRRALEDGTEENLPW